MKVPGNTSWLCVLATSATCLASSSANAASRVCADHVVVVEKLAAAYSESPMYTVLGKNGHIVTVFASEDHATWTLTVHSKTGPTCVVSSGRSHATLTETVAVMR